MTDETGLIVSLSYVTPEFSERTIPCDSLLLAAGPWTGRVYEKLFPKSQLRLPISNLAGWSVVFRDPTPPVIYESAASCHSAFTTSAEEGFSPEVFGRISSIMSQGQDNHLKDVGHDIYLAGLNSSNIPLPNNAVDVEIAPELHSPQIATLLRVAKRLFSSPLAVNSTPDGAITDGDHTLEVLRTGLCHRPVTPNGRPILTRIEPRYYAPQLPSRATFDAGMTQQGHGGLYVCAGHGPWGIALSLGSGKVCADMINGHKIPAYLSKLGL
jgi:glycine/D-amino acid oxidase-like deaminating enzyme